MFVVCIFFHVAATTELYTLSLHDALPIFAPRSIRRARSAPPAPSRPTSASGPTRSLDARADRKSTRLNSSHVAISYAVFCLKKKRPAFASLHFKTLHLLADLDVAFPIDSC